MAGMNFQYDETGGTFYYFMVSFYGLLLVPFTIWVLRRKEKQDNKDKDRAVCHCEPCQTKNRRISASLPKQRFLQNLLYLLVAVGWISFIWVAYRVSHIKTDDHVEYDPYEVLGIDRGSSDKEIRKAYRDLSKTHHPDKGGDEQLFLRIAKAYAALTDEESRKNWEEYGNPDGPGATQFGIALPKWLVEGSTSIWVLMGYVLVFMIVLPSVVGTWWYKSIKYSGDKILLPTQQLYFFFIHKTPNMIYKRALMILAASLEFWKKHNSEIVERPTDDEEMRQVMRSLPQSSLSEKNKEQPLCFPYSVKARALLLAHMQRLPLPANTLQQDLLYVLNKCPLLINEMVNTVAQLVAMSNMGQAKRPRLTTLEAIMKMSPLLVQGLWENSSQLLMLPHISEQMLKSFVGKKHNVRNCRQFCNLTDEERRNLLRHVEDQEYRNIMNVLKGLPAITMECDVKVLDDEDKSITANSIVTVSVKLKRESMFSKFSSQPWSPEENSAGDVDVISPEDAENEEDEDANEHIESEEAKKKKAKEKNKNKKSKGGKKKKTPAVPYKPKYKQSTPAAAAATPAAGSQTKEKQSDNEEDNEEDQVTANNTNSDDKSEGEQSEAEQDVKESDEEQDSAEQTDERADSNDEKDEDWEDFEAESKKHGKLELTSMVSHPVHCPYFPSEKQEYWWLYLSDRKNFELITVPVRITNLVDTLDVDVKFPAPKKPGSYLYTMCLKSDSYIDMDLYQNLKFDVKEAKIIENHPQWDISDEEEEEKSDAEEGSVAEDSESEFEYDDEE